MVIKFLSMEIALRGQRKVNIQLRLISGQTFKATPANFLYLSYSLLSLTQHWGTSTGLVGSKGQASKLEFSASSPWLSVPGRGGRAAEWMHGDSTYLKTSSCAGSSRESSAFCPDSGGRRGGKCCRPWRQKLLAVGTDWGKHGSRGAERASSDTVSICFSMIWPRKQG